MNVEHLLARGQRGLRGSRKPRQVDLRRQVSDLYYALFHALCALCADNLVGSTRRQSDARVRVYRSVTHGAAKDALRTSETKRIHQAVERLATLFVALQEERHRADYDPRPFPHGQDQVETFQQQAKAVIDGLRAPSADEKLALVTRILFRDRQP